MSVDGVSHAYGARRALDEVSFHVAPARFVALLGLNGAGKSTLFSLVTRLFGTQSGRISIFKVYGRSETEIVLGEDDRHLDFRLSVLRTPDLSPTLGGQLTVSTVVHCHNLLGRAYLLVIAPFHRLVVKASLRRAAHIGWPKAGTR